MIIGILFTVTSVKSTGYYLFHQNIITSLILQKVNCLIQNLMPDRILFYISTNCLQRFNQNKVMFISLSIKRKRMIKHGNWLPLVFYRQIPTSLKLRIHHLYHPVTFLKKTDAFFTGGVMILQSLQIQN